VAPGARRAFRRRWRRVAVRRRAALSRPRPAAVRIGPTRDMDGPPRY
jgi:hypothetical protein